MPNKPKVNGPGDYPPLVATDPDETKKKKGEKSQAETMAEARAAAIKKALDAKGQ